MQNTCRLLVVGVFLAGSFAKCLAQTNWALLSDPVYGSNTCELTIKGEPGGMWRLEGSSDLAHWDYLFTITNETGAMKLTEQGGSQDARFFRLAGSGTLAGLIAEEYCARAGVVSMAARLAIHQFVEGLENLNLLSNLADFAFFAEGQNTVNGELVSWRSQAKTVGSIVRHRGGVEFPNYKGTNHIFFTNLPPAPNGSTLVWWGSGNRSSGIKNDADQAYTSMAELNADGPELHNPVVLQYTFLLGAYGPQAQDTVHGFLAPGVYGRPGSSECGFFCAALGSSPTNASFVFCRDYPRTTYATNAAMTFRTWPTVARFGMSLTAGTKNGWWGLVRAFAYFNTELTAEQVESVNSLMPRIGLIVAGDSKSVYPQVWWEFWCDSPMNWGLMSVRTNSAISGALVSDNNRSEFYRIAYGQPSNGTSMERNFEALPSLFPTNATYPLTFYSLRAGHNDLNCANVVGIVSNAFTATTNLWTWAHTNGWRTVGWTIDRTTLTWPATGVFPTGASNALIELNGNLRQASSVLCDSFADQEIAYVNAYGPTPYTNTALYVDGVHDPGGSVFLGTNVLATSAVASFGYESPPQP